MKSISQKTEELRTRAAEASQLSLEVSKDRLQKTKSLRPDKDRHAAWRNKKLREWGYDSVKMVQKQGCSLNRDETVTDSNPSSLNDVTSDDESDDGCTPPETQSPSILQQKQSSPMASPRWRSQTIAPYPEEDSGWHRLKVAGCEDIPEPPPRRATTANTPRRLSKQRSQPSLGSRSPSLAHSPAPTMEGVLSRLNNIRFGSGSVDGADSPGNSRRTTCSGDGSSGGGGISGRKSVVFADGLPAADTAPRPHSGMLSGRSSGHSSPLLKTSESYGGFRALPPPPTPGTPERLGQPRRLPRRAASQLVMSSRASTGSLPTSQPGNFTPPRKERRASLLQTSRADKERIDQARRDAMGSILGAF
ncbi:hypothetical protein DUNSADRAFT_1433 [Dunaliella salina]|uniref:Uncharacterized protein n=1 Tax=Dunaliella salina TaxID=3046 RepID=A0ABQ7FXH3_DUNSA|nr:hypothetical protein DUNSADRAFT_1433 [Dunaliella salina]|eukprot:KAF5827050.1 hypothetical protein DUNSADRAFT_1433 [Dunaliella salina]